MGLAREAGGSVVAGRKYAREEEGKKSRERIGGLAVRPRSACRPGKDVGRADRKGVEERLSCVLRCGASKLKRGGRRRVGGPMLVVQHSGWCKRSQRARQGSQVQGAWSECGSCTRAVHQNRVEGVGTYCTVATPCCPSGWVYTLDSHGPGTGTATGTRLGCAPTWHTTRGGGRGAAGQRDEQGPI